MRIQQVPHAGAIQQWRTLSHAYVNRIINEYTEHESVMSNFGPIDGVDMFHCHSNPPEWLSLNKEFLSRTLFFFHGPPDMCRSQLSYAAIAGKDRCGVPAQMHSLYFREYSDMLCLRNPIMLDDQNLQPAPFPTDKLRICVPTSNPGGRGKIWYKGYHESIAMLEDLSEKYPDRIEVDSFYGLERDEYIERMSKCNIVVEGVTNPSYSRICLEALALGKVVVTNCSESILDLVRDVTKSKQYIPFQLADLSSLDAKILQLMEIGPKNLQSRGQIGADWMRRYWHPRNIANDYIRAYRHILDLPALE